MSQSKPQWMSKMQTSSYFLVSLQCWNIFIHDVILFIRPCFTWTFFQVHCPPCLFVFYACPLNLWPDWPGNVKQFWKRFFKVLLLAATSHWITFKTCFFGKEKTCESTLRIVFTFSVIKHLDVKWYLSMIPPFFPNINCRNCSYILTDWAGDLSPKVSSIFTRGNLCRFRVCSFPVSLFNESTDELIRSYCTYVFNIGLNSWHSIL